jgi:hypothetical protein
MVAKQIIFFIFDLFNTIFLYVENKGNNIYKDI